MAKDTTKNLTRADSVRRGLRARRAWFDRGDGAVAGAWSRWIQLPRVGWGVVIATVTILICGVLASWSRERPLVAVGRVMNDTRTVRVPLDVEDPSATESKRESARQRTPRVYVADMAVLDELQASILNLPITLAGLESIDQVDEKIREQFKLTPDHLAAIQGQAFDGKPRPEWESKVRSLVLQLRSKPLLDKQTWQRSTQELNEANKLSVAGATLYVRRGDSANVEDLPSLTEFTQSMARASGFTSLPLDVVVARLTSAPKPTFRFDAAATQQDANDAAAQVQRVIQRNAVGEVIFRRGDVLVPARSELYKAELGAFKDMAESWRIWLRRVAVMATVAAVTLACAGYAAMFSPRFRRDPARMAGVGLIMCGSLAIACLGSVFNPALMAITSIAPTVFVAVMLAVAYDQRVSMAFGVLHGVLVCVALDQGISTFAVILTGVSLVVWQLKEIRDRNTIFRMSVLTALALALATAIAGLLDRPLTPQVLRELLTDSGLAAAAALMVGGLTLFILPTVERLFDITTGLTLIELRDPRHPLLRELQQRAPGTYNHSLNVAAISEAAADAIGADSLLTYVGALYHDVGKMNKPDYFVENQSGGPNKHDKLSPAMSLLVIVGHVKDGLELAREFGLPRSLQHFIESHHGTTLVEYFYHRARDQALKAEKEAERQAERRAEAQPETADHEPEGVPMPDEFEYRYPGPKPRSKEAAIVMLSDAIESATRTLAEPTPSRIDALVRSIANKRLLDGQFDDCEMSLRDLNLIAESVSKSLASVYHGRITYRSTAGVTQRRA